MYWGSLAKEWSGGLVSSKCERMETGVWQLAIGGVWQLARDELGWQLPIGGVWQLARRDWETGIQSTVS